jgi:uncharacterized membrane protein YphA (DoxX/SURF4 family)
MKSSTWKPLLGIVASIFLGGVFLLAVAGKLIEPGAFAEQIRLEGLDFLLSAETVAVLALALETGLGLALVLGVRYRPVLILTGLLIVFFLFLTGRNYWLVAQGLRDAEASCGCFGSLVERTPAEAFWQDLFLLVPPFLLVLWGGSGRKAKAPRFRLGLAASTALVVGVLTALSPQIKFSRAAAEIAALEADQAYRESTMFQLGVDGQPGPGSMVYQSEGSVEILITSPSLPGPVLMDPRSREFRLLADGILVEKDDGVYLPSEPESVRSGDFQIEAGGIVFEVDNLRLTLEPRTAP